MDVQAPKREAEAWQETRSSLEVSQAEVQDVVRTELLRLDALVSAVTTGLLCGLVIFVATIWLVLKGGEVVGPHLGLLGNFFIGYDVTPVGSLVGFGYGFALGFLAAYFVAKVYNWLVDLKEATPGGPS